MISPSPGSARSVHTSPYHLSRLFHRLQRFIRNHLDHFLTDIVDHPGYRRPHREPVPRTGGMAIFISFFCALYFLEKVILHQDLPWSWLG